MRSVHRIGIAIIASVIVLAGGVKAHGYTHNAVAPASQSYSGTWPITVTHSQFSNGSDCLTLTQSGRNGGSATLVEGSRKFPYGSFTVVDGILVVTIIEPEGSQNGALLFIAHAKSGTIGQGLFENAVGGSNFDEGNLAFGVKGGC